LIRGGASSTIFAEKQVYRLIEKKRLPIGKLCAQFVAFPTAIGGDAGDANGDGPAGDAK